MGARVLQLELTLHGVEIELAEATALLVTESKKQSVAQIAIELEGPPQAVRHTQSAPCSRNRVSEQKRPTQYGCAVVREAGDGLGRKRTKQRHIDGDFVEEHTKAAPYRSAVVVRGGEDEADARGCIPFFRGQTVAIETNSQIEGQPRIQLPVILREDRSLFFRSGGGDRAAIGDLAGSRPVFAQDADRQIVHGAAITGIGKQVPESQQMPACELQRTKV